LGANPKILNATAYARVSTKSDDRLNSYEAQKSYYEAYIKAKPDWRFVEVYADAATGTSAKKRKNFTRMVTDALNGKIDIIIVKSISSFACKTESRAKTVRWGGFWLKEGDFAVLLAPLLARNV
jgi:DNA invertase Pin-like site-specific DNA recombinase